MSTEDALPGHDDAWGPPPAPDDESEQGDPNDNSHDDELGADALDDCGAEDAGAAELEEVND